ncbi:ABC transporter substrate-binding protein [Candidatus Desulfarcum epimagneticum]|uniref:ABC transporter substrate-binding protein n=1 Tax=uncultured Desulfobacteraceae bacterium TaxID=218296 RepID=A0A484HKS9_9BACT|nr:ABC transporter substrate-binding protein [uncultured Desulfobacteraceae bacterium]
MRFHSIFKKRALFMCLAACVLAAAAVSSPARAEAPDKVHIRFSTWHVPAGADVQKLWTPMLEEMKKRSGGRITHTLFSGGALGKGPDHYDIVKTGLSDMGYATLTWTPGRFPLSDVLSSPVVCPAKWKGAEIGMAMHGHALKDEFPDIKVLHINSCVMAHLWTTRPVKSLEDMKGMKIRSPGGLQTRAIQALGASPVFMPLGDVYLSMETGVIDGVVTCPALIKAFKLYEVAKHGVPVTFGCVAEGLFANQKFWDKLPEDLKAIIEDVGRNAYKIAGIFDEKWYDETMEDIGEKIKIRALDEKESARWNGRMKKMLANWAADMEKKGIKAKDTLKLYKKELDRHGVDSAVCPF